MADHADRLADYIEVPDRIRQFKEQFPEGSLSRDEWHLETVGERTFVVYTAKAFRAPDDTAPGIGTAWEPFPGKTPYTKDSELMNAETSAWGRALAALGFVGKKIATAEEVKARQVNGAGRNEGGDVPSPKQLDFMVSLARDLGASGADQELLRAYASTNLTGGKEGSGSKAIAALKGDTEMDRADALVRFVQRATEWQAKQTDLPADAEGLPVD